MQSSLTPRVKLATFITTIAPRTKDTLQQNALKSWLRCGDFVHIVSLNTEQEIQKFKTDPAVRPMYEFLLNSPHFEFKTITTTPVDGKMLVPLEDMCIEAKQRLVDKSTQLQDKIQRSEIVAAQPQVQRSEIVAAQPQVQRSEIVALINSDIVFGNPQTDSIQWLRQQLEQVKNLQNKYSMVVFRRYDYSNIQHQSKRCNAGIDVFFPTLGGLAVIPGNHHFRFGLPWWDYFLPMILMKRSHLVIEVLNRVFYHKDHPIRWNADHNRMLFGEYKRFISGAVECSELGKLNSLMHKFGQNQSWSAPVRRKSRRVTRVRMLPSSFGTTLIRKTSSMMKRTSRSRRSPQLRLRHTISASRRNYRTSPNRYHAPKFMGLVHGSLANPMALVH